MTLAVFLFFNLPQNIVCSGEWLPLRVCVTVFLTEREREHEKEGPSSNVKRKPLNMKEGGGLQSLFLSALVPGASVST